MKEQRKEKLKSIVSKASLFNIAIIVILIILIGVFAYLDSKTDKIIFNGKTLPQSYNSIIKEINGEKYLSIERFIDSKTNIPELRMYKKQNGLYDNSKKVGVNPFFVDSPYEAVQFEENEKEFTKYIKFEYLNRMINEKGKVQMTPEELSSPDITEPIPREKTKMDEFIFGREHFTLARNLVVEGDDTYISLQDARYTFNMKFNMSKDNKKLYIETIGNIEKRLAPSLADKGLNLPFNYQNRRAVLDNVVVVVNGSNYGVYEIENGNQVGKNIIAETYKDLRYVQSDKSNKAYIIDSQDKFALKKVDTGDSIIHFGDYANIEVYSEELGLYKVSNGNKFGILNDKAQIVVPIENEKIGYDMIFFNEARYEGVSEDGRVFLGELIPVSKKQDNGIDTWGFYSVKDIQRPFVKTEALIEIGSKVLKRAVEVKNNPNQVKIQDATGIKELESHGIRIGNVMDKEEALKYGYTTDESLIRNNASAVLTIPRTNSLGQSDLSPGIVVKDAATGNYGVIAKGPNGQPGYIVSPVFKYIFKQYYEGRVSYKGINLNGIEETINISGTSVSQQGALDDNNIITPPKTAAPVPTPAPTTLPNNQTAIPGIEDEYGNNLNQPRFDQYGNPLDPNYNRRQNQVQTTPRTQNKQTAPPSLVGQ